MANAGGSYIMRDGKRVLVSNTVGDSRTTHNTLITKPPAAKAAGKPTQKQNEVIADAGQD